MSRSSCLTTCNAFVRLLTCCSSYLHFITNMERMLRMHGVLRSLMLNAGCCCCCCCCNNLFTPNSVLWQNTAVTVLGNSDVCVGVCLVCVLCVCEKGLASCLLQSFPSLPRPWSQLHLRTSISHLPRLLRGIKRDGTKKQNRSNRMPTCT